MTPKEKAEELVEKFMLWKFQKCELSKKQAKKCALIAVDEIIKEYGTYYKIEVDGKYVSYWKEVKNQIELL
jgi:hypothetical protein